MRKQVVSMAKRSTAVHGVGRMLDTVVPSSGRVCTVLTFHRIETHDPDLYPGLAGLDADGFERFMDDVADAFVPIGVDRFVAGLTGHTDLPERSVLVTFDDAYRDFSEVAWPIMAERGVPVVLFVPTAYPDDPDRRFWWDELYTAIAAGDPSDWRRIGIDGSTPVEAFNSVRDGVKSRAHDDAMEAVGDMVAELRGSQAPPRERDAERVLGWAELERLAGEGVALAPHSRTHPMLDQLEADRLDAEIRGSLDDMHERLGPRCVEPVFAYPSGGHDPRVRAAVERAGFSAAFTTERGLVDVGRSDRVRLPRLNIGRDASVGSVRTESAIHRTAHWMRSATRRGPG